MVIRLHPGAQLPEGVPNLWNNKPVTMTPEALLDWVRLVFPHVKVLSPEFGTKIVTTDGGYLTDHEETITTLNQEIADTWFKEPKHTLVDHGEIATSDIAANAVAANPNVAGKKVWPGKKTIAAMLDPGMYINDEPVEHYGFGLPHNLSKTATMGMLYSGGQVPATVRNMQLVEHLPHDGAVEKLFVASFWSEATHRASASWHWTRNGNHKVGTGIMLGGHFNGPVEALVLSIVEALRKVTHAKPISADLPIIVDVPALYAQDVYLAMKIGKGMEKPRCKLILKALDNLIDSRSLKIGVVCNLPYQQGMHASVSHGQKEGAKYAARVALMADPQQALAMDMHGLAHQAYEAEPMTEADKEPWWVPKMEPLPSIYDDYVPVEKPSFAMKSNGDIVAGPGGSKPMKAIFSFADPANGYDNATEEVSTPLLDDFNEAVKSLLKDDGFWKDKL
ncbi:hypothetical protein [Roseococcus pinisoli]|uniref:Uncharacterized protein n=1 Tax=Roseococcus pinisoli TaxID=2835040 RepID=A0ABS5QF21_9PROT|nr:hypothetical protein [Roseococcus pinisoli]MBS7812294.1 hypothetical protein [Roseococcus pinisoli]